MSSEADEWATEPFGLARVVEATLRAIPAMAWTLALWLSLSYLLDPRSEWWPILTFSALLLFSLTRAYPDEYV